MMQSRWVGIVLFALLVGTCCSRTAVALQDFGIQTEVEDTAQISLDLLSQPDTFEKEIWLNWTVRMTVLEWNPDWTTIWDHPSLTVLVRTPSVNFTEYNNVSFGLNRTGGGFGMTLKFTHYLHVFATFDLGNLTDVTTQTLIVSVKFADDMPSNSYTLEINIYDRAATTTETSTTITTGTTTTTEDTTGTDEQLMEWTEYILPLSVGAILVVVVVVLLKRR